MCQSRLRLLILGTQGVASGLGLEARASASPKPPSAPYLLRTCATTALRLSDATGRRDRDKSGALSYPRRLGGAAQRGGTIICRRRGCLYLKSPSHGPVVLTV